ncbi:hypothetical protein [Sphingomonas oryzagri]
MDDVHMPVPFEEGGRAVAEEGIVLLDGPDGIAISMTADAAEQTGSSLIEAAREAREQTSRG